MPACRTVRKFVYAPVGSGRGRPAAGAPRRHGRGQQRRVTGHRPVGAGSPSRRLRGRVAPTRRRQHDRRLVQLPHMTDTHTNSHGQRGSPLMTVKSPVAKVVSSLRYILSVIVFLALPFTRISVESAFVVQ